MQKETDGGFLLPAICSLECCSIATQMIQGWLDAVTAEKQVMLAQSCLPVMSSVLVGI